MNDLNALIAQREAIDAEITRVQSQSKAEGVAKVRELMATHGLTVDDLKTAPVRKVAVKYRNATGDTWTGRGMKPVWVRNALAAGLTLDMLKAR